MMQRAANETSIRIVGMSRSGNHAIIHWLLRALDGRRWCFLNCVEPGADPWATARPMDDGRRWVASGDALLPGSKGASPPTGYRDYLIRSYEDTFLKPVFGTDHHDAGAGGGGIGASGRCLDVLILRDPFNLFASRRRSATGLVNERVAMRIWKQHARTFLAGRFGRRRLVTISYNAWVADDAYRRRTAAALGLSNSPEGLGRVASCNGGSSFDGLSLANRPERMRVLERWQHYADDHQFFALFDDEAQRMATRLFARTNLPLDRHGRFGGS
jgi:hypothetical protein